MDTRETRLITTSFGLSLLLHATVLVPVFTVALSSTSSGETASTIDRDRLAALPVEPPDLPERKPDEPKPEEPPTKPASKPPSKPEDQEVRLGIDDGADSSMNWIGYAEYQEHLAALADGPGSTDRAPLLQELWDRLGDVGLPINFVGRPGAAMRAAPAP